MNKFLPGFFIGAAIGLLIAPQKGSELRHELKDGYKQLQNKISHTETPANDISTTINNAASPITLPAEALESAKPTNIPIGASNTSETAPDTTTPPDVPHSTYNTDPMETLKDTKSNTNRPYQASGKRYANKGQTNADQNRKRS
jgi:gas vesicle protein